MDETVLTALRWAQYLSLALLFGLPLFALPRNGLIAALAAVGLLVSVAGFIALTASMLGIRPTALDVETLTTVAQLPGIGTSFEVRSAALLLALIVCAVAPPLARAVAVFTGGIALASLAWNGHAAVTEGSAGILHLSADVIHLLAAGTWIAAVAAFLVTAMQRDSRGQLSSQLTAFAVPGTFIVALLIVTGFVNLVMIAGWPNLTMLNSRYGQLLAVKLLLFTAMFGLAALHRYSLVPALANGSTPALKKLRTSLSAELLAGLTILALVAVLGLLPPP